MWAAAYLEKTPASLSGEEWVVFLSNVQSVERTFNRERSEKPAFGLMWAAAYSEKTPASLSREEGIAFLSNVQSVAQTFSRERSEKPASKVVIRGR